MQSAPARKQLTRLSECLSSVRLSNGLPVGRITNCVNRKTPPSRAPATSYQNVAPASHAAIEDSRPKDAKVACMGSAYAGPLRSQNTGP